MSEKLYNVGMYVRLSRENTAYANGDSVSIENQQAMMSKFIAMMPGWVETRTYIDNGASGGNFDRQGFQDMMTDIRSGVINLVLVSDLSRFGRNYLEAGRYLEEELPALGCRFVAMADGVDTDTGENDIMPFLNAMNDFYLKNLSGRIKSVFQAKANNGHKLTGTAPYGFLRNPDDHTKLIVDDYAADVVRRIYKMRVDGLGYGKIVAALNADRIPPPRRYFYQRQNRKPAKTCSEFWQIHSIPTILKDEHYLGHTVSCKHGRSYRNSKAKNKPQSEWVKIQNTHEAIIDIGTWEQVQEVNARLAKTVENARKPQPSLFTGKLFCADCNVIMMPHSELRSKKSEKRRTSYSCKTYHITGRQSCSRHGINEDTLKKIVLEQIKAHAEQIRLDEKAALRKLQEKLNAGYVVDKVELSKEIQALKQELHKIDVQTEQLYEDKITGIISADTFTRMTEKSEQHRTEVADRIVSLEASSKEAKAKHEDIKRWVHLIKENSALEDVDRDLLETLIERVEVGEKVVQDGVKSQEVKVYYKFVGMV